MNKILLRLLICPLVWMIFSIPAAAQQPAAHRQRLILTDGSFQIVTQYQILGDRVRYFSAERRDWEEVPKSLVNWAATAQWNKDNAPGATAPPNPEAAKIDAEEQRERLAVAGMTPLVAPGLYLPASDGVWALDTYRTVPELIELDQNSGQLNHQMSHNVFTASFSRTIGRKKTIELPRPHARIQLHTSTPVIYVALDQEQPPQTGQQKMENGGKHRKKNASQDASNSGSGILTVQTNGMAQENPDGINSSPKSHYAIVRVHPMRDARSVGVFKVGLLGEPTHSEEAISTRSEILPGNQWMKVVPRAPLPPGEYAMVELLPKDRINLDVWDFGINPQAPENPDAQTAVGRPSTHP